MNPNYVGLDVLFQSVEMFGAQGLSIDFKQRLLSIDDFTYNWGSYTLQEGIFNALVYYTRHRAKKDLVAKIHGPSDSSGY